MNKEALTCYRKELERLYSDSFRRAQNHTLASSEGYLEFAFSGNRIEPVSSSEKFMRKQEVGDYHQLRLINMDGEYSLPLIIGRTFNYAKYLGAYCKVVGYKIRGNHYSKEGILVSDISYSEATYDFDNDSQFLNLDVENLDDLLTLFPDRSLVNNREQKEKSLLFSLVGAQEKKSTCGGVGVSILSPDLRKAGAGALMSQMANNWYPYSTRGKVVKESASFLGGDGAEVMQKISYDPRNFINYKINRGLFHNIPHLERDSRVLNALRYSHSHIHLSEELEWLEQSNSVDMFLMRARSKRVSVSSRVSDEAREKEKNLSMRFYEDFNAQYKCPEAVLDFAECLTRLSGKSVVSSNNLREAEDLIYSLRKESAEEIGAETKLFSGNIVEMRGSTRQVYLLIGLYGNERSQDELKQMASEKGISGFTFKKIISQLSMDGEVYKDRRDGEVFLRTVSEVHLNDDEK